MGTKSVSKPMQNQPVRVFLTSDSIVEGLLGEVASLIRRVQDLVVEDREVEGKTQADRVGRGQLSLSDLSGSLVGLKGLIGRVLATVANGELGEVAVVVTLPVWVLVGLFLELLFARSRQRLSHTSCGRRP